MGGRYGCIGGARASRPLTLQADHTTIITLAPRKASVGNLIENQKVILGYINVRRRSFDCLTKTDDNAPDFVPSGKNITHGSIKLGTLASLLANSILFGVVNAWVQRTRASAPPISARVPSIPKQRQDRLRINAVAKVIRMIDSVARLVPVVFQLEKSNPNRRQIGQRNTRSTQ